MVWLFGRLSGLNGNLLKAKLASMWVTVEVYLEK